jgi:putative chitinase
MTLSAQQIRAMMPNAGDRLTPHLPFISPALAGGHIDTPREIAAFMAQVAHESGEFLYMEEIADGSEYEGRLDLGNTQPGDGRKFRGHGPIQITGRTNTAACGAALGIDALADPTVLEKPENAMRSAVWFWNTRGLSPLADADNFKAITERINGGLNGYAERLVYWHHNRHILGLPAPVDDEGAAAAADVKAIQTALQAAGYYVDSAVDGIFGPDSRNAVVAFQTAQGLVADGIVGPLTRQALGL